MGTTASSQMDQCIQNCVECYRVCQATMVHCLQKGGRHAALDHMTLMADCAKICAASADYMIRQSPRHNLTCGVCATVCDACAKDCQQMADDPPMQQCAEVCRRCAESCRKMTGGK